MTNSKISKTYVSPNNKDRLYRPWSISRNMLFEWDSRGEFKIVDNPFRYYNLMYLNK